jgi:hypothetical protein
MGKVAKIILGLVVAAIAVVAVVVVLVLQNLDAIIKGVIEDVGTKVVGTPVTVQEVKFSLQDGRGEIRGLRIANLSGYSADSLFEMSEVAVQVEPRSLAGPVIVINEVLVEGALLNAEQKGTTTNIQQLLDNMPKGSDEPPPPPSDDPKDTRLMMEKFSFRDNSATLLTEQFGEKSLKLPSLLSQAALAIIRVISGTRLQWPPV